MGTVPTRRPGQSSALTASRHVLRRWISLRPGVYLPLARWKNDHTALGEQTELLVDGFTRSAGTFAAIAFQFAQNDHVRVAHHMHAAAAMVMAARRGVPALLTVREPEPTILSAAVREPGIPLTQWLKTYVAFYERIRPFRSGFVVGAFEEVTTDLGAVIRRVNERFGRAFRSFEHTEQNVEAVFALIDERAEGPPWQPHLNRFVSGLISLDQYRAATERYRLEGRRPAIPELRVQRPTAERRAAKEELQAAYRGPSLAPLRAAAERAYAGLASPAPGDHRSEGRG